MEEMNTPQKINPPLAKKIRTSVLKDARKLEISMKGCALLQWDFHNETGPPGWSLQMPEDVIDQILTWRDEFKK